MWKWIVFSSIVLIVAITLTFNLTAEVNVISLSGSTREDSLNKKLAKEVAAIAQQQGMNAVFIDLRDYPLPFFDEDIEAKGMPENVRKIRDKIKKSDIIFIASPNYNRAPSGVLKNLLDWVSRGETGGRSKELLAGKKIIIMSASGGASGGSKGLPALRSILEAIGGTVVQQEVVVPKAHEAFDENGHLIDQKVITDLQQAIQQATSLSEQNSEQLK